MKKNILVLVIIIAIIIITGSGYLVYNQPKPEVVKPIVPPVVIPVTPTPTPNLTPTPNPTPTDKQQACLSSGGIVGTVLCCNSAGDFPNSCNVGACGCSPAYSHQIKTCNCGQGKCFNGTACVALGH